MPEETKHKTNKPTHHAPTEKHRETQEPKTNLGQSEPTEAAPKKRFYKRFWFWLIVVLGIITVAGGVFLGIYATNQSKNKQAISKGWHDITQQANTVDNLSKKIDNKDSYESYTTELQKLNSIVADSKFSAERLKYKAKDAQNYDLLLSNFGKYIEQSVKYSDNINDFTDDNADSLNDLSRMAKDASDNLKNNTSYLTESMPVDIFNIAQTLTDTNRTLLTKELATKAKQLAEQAASAKDAADKKAVETTANNYLNAFVAGNAANLRRYMTEAFQKEYDFNQLTPESRQYSYPVSFRILTNQKVDGAKYKVQANVINKLRDGSGQFTVGNDMSIVYNSASASWLVDSIKEGSSF